MIIKILLISFIVLICLVLVMPGRGARRLAIRRIALLFVGLAGVLAVAFPEIVNTLANYIGVGRGTDLILYVLVVVFVGNSISSSLRARQLEAQITILARSIAIEGAQKPKVK